MGGLSCTCDFEPSDYDHFWMDHSDLKPMPAMARRKRCCSCKSLIQLNEDTIEFYQYRMPKNDIEERIHGEYVRLASSFTCEECSGLYLALEELGYNCLDISVPMRDYISEYNNHE